MIYPTFNALMEAYLQHLEGRPCYQRTVRVATQWIDGLTATPTRAQLLARMREKCPQDFAAGATQANKELALVRAACRWGIYRESWDGDPTVGIKKWKSPKRKRLCKYDELRKLLHYFDFASTEAEIRDRALFGLMLFTGCRPSEARSAKVSDVTAYGLMGNWHKGRTKTGETQEVPLPAQLMPWLAAWKAIRPTGSPYLFPGQEDRPTSADNVRLRWDTIRTQLVIHGLWTYDLRRTLACSLGNELKPSYDDHTIRAILNHSDGAGALGHYYFKSFDSLTGPIQAYADWLWALKGASPYDAGTDGIGSALTPAAKYPLMPLSAPAATAAQRTGER